MCAGFVACSNLLFVRKDGTGMLGVVLFAISLVGWLIIIWATTVLDIKYPPLLKKHGGLNNYFDAMVVSLEATIIMAVLFAIVVILPVRGLGVDPKEKSELICSKIQWIESGQVEADLTERGELYQEINKYNTLVQKGKKNHSNIWNGVFVNDNFLEVEEILMPTWLSISLSRQEP